MLFFNILNNNCFLINKNINFHIKKNKNLLMYNKNNINNNTFFKYEPKLINLKINKKYFFFNYYKYLSFFKISKSIDIYKLRNFKKKKVINKINFDIKNFKKINIIIKNSNFFKFTKFNSIILNNLLLYLNISNFTKTTRLDSFSNFYKKKNKTFYNEFNRNIFLESLILDFVEFFTSKKIYIHMFKNNFSIFNYKPAFFTINVVYRRQFLVFFSDLMDFKYFSLIVASSLKFKDVNLFYNLVSFSILKLKLKKHRRFLKFISRLFITLSSTYFSFFNIKGIQIEWRGKISVDKDMRKRRLLFKFGKISKSNFDTKVSHIIKPLRTISGSMGLKIWIFY